MLQLLRKNEPEVWVYDFLESPYEVIFRETLKYSPTRNFIEPLAYYVSQLSLWYIKIISDLLVAVGLHYLVEFYVSDSSFCHPDIG